MTTAAELPAPISVLPAGLTFRMVEVLTHPSSFYPVHPGRYVVEGVGPWDAASPEVCTDLSNKGVWLSDGVNEVLVCPGCGLDCT
ncbi:hypothetical protein [Kitasatospora sp. NPDC093679]|uniref:hypothetical protein n=1 Tax=Kitasatospora sp. NPDC093679 TaxID=3154983 RepID=UPI00341D7FC6